MITYKKLQGLLFDTDETIQIDWRIPFHRELLRQALGHNLNDFPEEVKPTEIWDDVCRCFDAELDGKTPKPRYNIKPLYHLQGKEDAWEYTYEGIYCLLRTFIAIYELGRKDSE